MKAWKNMRVILILLLLLTGCQSQVKTPEPTPSAALAAALTEIEGSVSIKAAGAADFTPAQVGMTLAANDAVRTGSDGRARLDLSSGTIVRVAPSSVFSLTSNEQQPDQSLATKIKLELGQVFVVLNGGSVEVETPSGQASVRGSYLMVFIDPNTLDVYVTCFEGDCGAGNDGGVVKFNTGQAVRLVHGQPGDKPIPPIFNLMDEADIQEWLDKVPESKEILETVFATLTAYPTATLTETPTMTATATHTPLPTSTGTPTNTPTVTQTKTPVPTWTFTPSPTKPSPTPTLTFVPTQPPLYTGFTVGGVNLNGAGGSVTVSPGSPVNVTYSFQVYSDGCIGCVTQLVTGLGSAGTTGGGCAFDGGAGGYPGVTGFENTTLTAPPSPGTYYVVVEFHWQYTCGDAIANYGTGGVGGTAQIIGEIIVLGLP